MVVDFFHLRFISDINEEHSKQFISRPCLKRLSFNSKNWLKIFK